MKRWHLESSLKDGYQLVLEKVPLHSVVAESLWHATICAPLSKTVEVVQKRRPAGSEGSKLENGLQLIEHYAAKPCCALCEHGSQGILKLPLSREQAVVLVPEEDS